MIRFLIGCAIGAAIAIAIGEEADASPFLVCTPVTSSGNTNTLPVSYTITGIGSGPITTPATTNANGSVQLHYDLGTAALGSYTITATATNSAGTSAASAPFTFSLPFVVTPVVPSGLSLSPQ
jgi:hypothetical protein